MSAVFSKRFVRTTVAISSLLVTPLLVAQAPGGFLDAPGGDARPLLSQGEIQSIVPERGSFTFPAPYNTQAVRLTNASDCGGNNCVNGVGYAYWRNTNNHVGSDSMLIFLSLDKNRGGSGPTLFEYNKVSRELNNLGPIFDENSAYSWATGEGWYFSASMPTKLYFNDDSRLMRHDVISNETETIVDISEHLGGGHYVWQLTSSDDDQVHVGTVRAHSNYAMLGCFVYNSGNGSFQYFAGGGDFDECQIDKSGRWLLIKEDVDGRDGEDNRIIDLHTGHERVLLDRDGAGGHSDLGNGYMIAHDNWADTANTIKMWDFTQDVLQGVPVYSNVDWNVAIANHISHTNARADLAPQEQYACGSASNGRNAQHANEIICFGLAGQADPLVVAPVMTDMSSGGGNEAYSIMPKGNLDVTGQYFIWTSNMGGNRLDAFIVEVPGHLLADAPAVAHQLTPVRATPPARQTSTATGGETSVTINAGISADRGASFTDTVQAPRVVTLEAMITPEPSHIGSPASILLMIEFPDGGFYTINGANDLVPVDPDSAPPAYARIEALPENYSGTLLEGMIHESYRGPLNIYLGYQLDSTGEIYFNAEAVTLYVE